MGDGRRGRGRPRGDGVDRISSLPDDLLHMVLLRLQSTPDAVRTSVLSRRWRRVWAQVPEISFDQDYCDRVLRLWSSSILRGIDAVVAAHSAPTLDRLAISVRRSAGDCTAALVAPWRRLASQRLTGELEIRFLPPTTYGYTKVPVRELEVPACERATVIDLDLRLHLRLAPTGSFAALRSLSIDCEHLHDGDLERAVSTHRCRRHGILAFLSGSSSHHTNPFAIAAPVPIAAASVNLINITSVILDFDDSNYAQWSTFLDNTFLKFGLIDHVDGTVDAQLCLHDAEWTQIDHCIVSWLYNTVSKGIMDTVFQPRRTAFSLWMAIRNLFLDNAMHRAVYALQEFHSLFQGDMSVTEYSRLKQLSNQLRDVGHPMSDPALVINTLRGLNSKSHNAISVIGAQRPTPSFLAVRSYLLQEERQMENRHKMEAATALMAAGSSSTAGKPSAPPASSPSFSPTKPASDKKKKRKQSDGRPRQAANTSFSQGAPPQQPWGTTYNPWTRVVQAWSMPQWRAPGTGVLGPRPGNNQALLASHQTPPSYVGTNTTMQPAAPPQLLTALQGLPAPGSSSTPVRHLTWRPTLVALPPSLPALLPLILLSVMATMPVHHTGHVAFPTLQSPRFFSTVIAPGISIRCALQAPPQHTIISRPCTPPSFGMLVSDTLAIQIRCSPHGLDIDPSPPASAPTAPPPSPPAASTPGLDIHPSPPASPTTAPPPSSPAAPVPAPPPTAPTHHMVTRAKAGIFVPNPRFAHVATDVSLPSVPTSVRTALHDPAWHAAMDEEFKALQANNTWSLVPRPPGAHRAGVDFDQTFSPIVKPAFIRAVLTVAASHDWPVHQLDVKNAFLHGHLRERVYYRVCLLTKSLYGLKQAPRAWYTRFTDHLRTIGFTATTSDTSLFVYRKGSATAYLLLYVDDIVLTASSTELMEHIVGHLHREFAMKDLGALNYFLGIHVHRTKAGLFLNQTKYAEDVLERAGMFNCKPAPTPVDTKPKSSSRDGTPASDDSFYRSIVVACIVLAIPHGMPRHATVDLRLLRLLRRLTHLLVFAMANNSEYRAVANATAECCWIRNLLHEMHIDIDKATVIYCDNISAELSLSTSAFIF
ncbi:hypothetical protein HU200_051537 [Digitaria exilis]|uniref:Uncharacterized protein n=1 Tax=Digitaria exilis TaxID=1010633 RepID=A0A835AKQ0_9POAL|nr:hypothetical protein HU200_051537 [Digitaria exilis]